MNKSRLVSIISKASNKYGDKLVDFMDKYNLYNLQSASEEQLQEYIEEKGLVETKLDDRLPKLIKEECEQKEKKIMKKLFISQPMNGKTDEEILRERNEAINIVKDIVGEEVEVLETFFDDFGPDKKPLHYLAKSLECLAEADIAYFVPGWENARGCKIEHQCAVEYGIERIE